MNHRRLRLLRRRGLALLLQLGRPVRLDLRLRSSLPLRFALRLLLLWIGLCLRLLGARLCRSLPLTFLEPLLLLKDLKVRLLASAIVTAIIVVLLRECSPHILTKDRLRCSHCRHRKLGAAPTHVRKPERTECGVSALELLRSGELVGREPSTR